MREGYRRNSETFNQIYQKKIRPIINKKYPGADFRPNYHDDDGYNKYEDLVNLFDPPECICIEERINEMEEHLNLLLEEDLFCNTPLQYSEI